ncbi:aminotransferase [Agromyces sp. Leaf222]|uniref:aminotransferase n=1 Tax=Agromyces sp. Leaf222 TaxID=1735688 RepID=UPI0006F4BE00|nr:aminotransferase [Agromyces sp. Leaf222]KQM81223.1 4-aminobutyrate aminotransferase [Agromyces sp. Leaf222]
MPDVNHPPRGFDFFEAGELAAPNLPPEEVAALLREHWGLDVELRSLGSQQDQNFLAFEAAGSGEADGSGGSGGSDVPSRDDALPIGVVKITNPGFTATELAAQDAAATLIAERAPSLRIATTTTDAEGRPRSIVAVTSEGPLSIRLIEFLDGGTLHGSAYLSPHAVARLGELAARTSLALADFDHDGLDRVLQWDPRFADRVVELLAPHHPDASRRERVTDAAAAAWAAITALAGDLPTQAVHLDLTDDNVVRAVDAGVSGSAGDPGLPGLPGLPDGLIDFGDVTRSWAVAELAITISSVLHHAGAEPVSVLPAIRAFHALRPLSSAEVAAIWPLVVVRGAVLVVSGEHQVQLDGGANAYAADGIEREWRIFEQAVSVPSEVMTGAIAADLGVEPPARAPATGSFGVILRGFDAANAANAVRLDVSPESDAVDAGAWLDAGLEERLALAALDAGASAAWLPRATPRLTESRIRSAESSATIPTGIDVWFAEPQVLEVVESRGSGVRLLIEAATPSAPDQPVVDGLPARTRIRIRLERADGPAAPHLVRPEYANGWLAQTLDPAPVLGLATSAGQGPNGGIEPETETETDHALLSRRTASFAEVQEHYYEAPPRIERGWREHLVGVDGRAYLDMVNNVTPLGHGHVGVADAVSRQLRRLNTNSRFHYGAVVEYAERLAALAPDPLDTVFLVNSGSEATDLAIRVALAATGRRDVVAILEAYHGWTYASDAVSTSVADNPNALETRPDWVHGVDTPNPFRGVHRGADAANYASEAADRIARLAADGRPPAAFIAETFFGNAGGIPLPDGYLAEIYAAVRAAGGLAIADEVQAGFGRLGHWFWGFEQQGVVPDVIAVAKAAGNGYPLGAVITTREIAARFRSQGYFFSSTGGSPASSVAGLAVLDAFRDEGLQRNALDVGTRLKHRLEELAARHPLIGAVHGLGLYLGVEFVRDRATLAPATAETAAICDRLLELGVVMQPTGDHQNVLKTKPPLCLDDDSADFFVAMLDRVLAEGW